MKNPITLTERASEVISNSLNARGKGLGIRFGTRTAGCSGQAYIMEFVDKLNTHDTLYEIDGNSVIIDEKSLVYLAGLEVDFKKEGLNEGFHFSNPNATGECGCGESFTV